MCRKPDLIHIKKKERMGKTEEERRKGRGRGRRRRGGGGRRGGKVAHACNPSYSEGRDQVDRGLKLAGANSWRDPISKKPITKIGLMEWLKV
jgi:hypothetical protein